MPFRTVSVDGAEWRVYPSGYLTANVKDEFSLIFSRGEGAERESRVVRYSPQQARTREQSFAQLSEADLLHYFHHSQPSGMAPETFYAR